MVMVLEEVALCLPFTCRGPAPCVSLHRGGGLGSRLSQHLAAEHCKRVMEGASVL